MHKIILITITAMIISVGTLWSQETETNVSPEMEVEETSQSDKPLIEVYFSGDVDADIAFGVGKSYAGIGHALDANFTFGTAFGEKVTAELYATMTTGDSVDLPAFGPVGGKWTPTMVFDGVVISVSDLFGALSLDIMDYGYDTGSSGYYLFKNQDMILPLTYPRGLKASVAAGDKVAIEAGFGVEDVIDTDINTLYIANSKISAFKEDGSGLLNVHFAAAKEHAADNFSFMATGLDLAINDYFNLYAGFLLPTISSAEIAFQGGIEGVAGGDFSVAYALSGGTDSPERLALGSTFTELFMVYMEPGYVFNEYFAAGLPLEFHHYGEKLNGVASSQVWAVPTLYFYPMAGMEIWVWGQAVLEADTDPGVFAGMEVMFSF